ncbi:MAG: hypothetical protein LBU36_04630 [Clostridiales bacterium]|nr:hypothetical protein [Clostridiales bacterium]
MDLFQSTNVAAYYLWEYTEHQNALDLWYCAEDMAAFLERGGYLSPQTARAVLASGKQSPEYIEFMRCVAFYIYIYTNNPDDFINWLAAERLIGNSEFLSSICDMATIYNENKGEFSKLTAVRSAKVKSSYM